MHAQTVFGSIARTGFITEKLVCVCNANFIAANKNIFVAKFPVGLKAFKRDK